MAAESVAPVTGSGELDQDAKSDGDVAKPTEKNATTNESGSNETAAKPLTILPEVHQVSFFEL